jgi:hypothetical protein
MTDDRTLAARQTIADLLEDCQASDDPETAAARWLELEAIRDDAARAVAEAGEWAAKVLASQGQYRVEANGVRIVRNKPKARTAWRKPELLDELRRLIPKVDRLMSPSTGEVEGDGEVAVRLFNECLSWSSAKVTSLRKYGMDPDEWCETVEKPETVRVETL